MRFAKRLLCACVILFLPTWALAHEERQHAAGDLEKRGTVHIPVSCSTAAQAQLAAMGLGELNKAEKEKRIEKKDDSADLLTWHERQTEKGGNHERAEEQQ